MRLKLAIITNRYPVDADDLASPFVHHVCRELLARDVDLRVLTPAYPTDRAERDSWVQRFQWTDSKRVFGELSLRRPADVGKILKGLRAGRAATRRLLSDFQPEMLLSLWALPSGWWAMQGAQSAGLPYAVWCLGSDVQLWGRRWGARKLIRGILRNAALVYADGFALAEETTRLADRPCEFLPSLRPLAATSDSALFPESSDDPFVLYYGRICRDKGVVDLLEAARLLPPEHPLRVVLAGVAAPGFDVEREIEQRRVADRCVFVGPQPADMLRAYIRAAKAVVIPSHRDSIPLVFGEAIQLGTPVICSDLPDLCEVLGRYPLGQVFTVGHPESLCRAITGFKVPTRFASDAARFLADFSPGRAAEKILADACRTLGRPVPTVTATRGKGVVCA